jgi:serine/threonine protein kinase
MEIETLLTRYQIQHEIGKGSYGIVYKARDLETSTTIALKKLQIRDSQGGFSNSIVREVSLLRQLSHPNIVSIKDFFTHEESDYITFEYLNIDLRNFMNSISTRLPESAIKFYTHQILKGLSYCHNNLIVHRDLKPQNLLLNNEELKIADFGLAKNEGESLDPSTPLVQTLWYRAPEIIMGAKETEKIDLWSVGCIFAEMITGRPLCTGTNSVDQLWKIFDVFGTPDESDWPGIGQYIEYQRAPKYPKHDFTGIFPGLSSDGINFISRLLSINPDLRMSAKEAKNHVYLREFNYETYTRD